MSGVGGCSSSSNEGTPVCPPRAPPTLTLAAANFRERSPSSTSLHTNLTFDFNYSYFNTLRSRDVEIEVRCQYARVGRGVSSWWHHFAPDELSAASWVRLGHLFVGGDEAGGCMAGPPTLVCLAATVMTEALHRPPLHPSHHS